MDGGCEQTLLDASWTVLHETGRSIELLSAFASHPAGGIFPVVSACAKAILPDGRERILVVHEGLLDSNPLQRESCLSTHQALKDTGNVIDERAPHELDMQGAPGTQSARFSGELVPLSFDGSSMYLRIERCTPEEYETLPKLVLTAPGSYDPPQRLSTRRLPSSAPRELADWQACLGYPSMELTRKTLKATTQLVPDVESETREILRDHLKSRLALLRYQRTTERCFADVFFSSVPSIRGYRCFLLFAYEDSGLDVVHLMQRKSQVATGLQDLFRHFRVPACMFTDNAPEFVGEKSKWKALLRSAVVDSASTEPHHPNQNPAEHRGGLLKAATLHMMQRCQVPLFLWCYAIEFMALVRQHLPKRSIGWRTSFEKFWSDTPDISVFRFPFWCCIWFYVKSRSFPQSKMLPGRFLGIAERTGDRFTYLIWTTALSDNGQPKILARSVIRRRYLRPNEIDTQLPTRDTSDQELDFLLSGNRSVTVSDEELSELLSSEQNILPANEVTSDHTDIDTGNATDREFEDLRETVAVLERPSKRQCVTPTSNGEPPPVRIPMEDSNTEDALLSSSSIPSLPSRLPDSEEAVISDDETDDASVVSSPDSVDPVLEDEVARSLEDDIDDEDTDTTAVGHSWRDGALFLQLKYSTGDTVTQSFQLAKRDFPLTVAHYIINNKIATEPHLKGQVDRKYRTGGYGRWARNFLRAHKRSVRRILRARCAIPVPSRRLVRRTTKPGRNTRQPSIKYGHKVPRSVREALAFDKAAGNTKWREAIDKEIASLLALQCFDFIDKGSKPKAGYQFVPVHMVFDVKSDGRYKARLVAGGHLVDTRGIYSHSSVVKSISIRLLDVIAHKQGLTMLCGDIGNAFVTAPNLEKVYTRAGPEFGELEGLYMYVRKALYGLRSASRAFRLFFAEFLRKMGFRSTLYDKDVWMRLRDDGSGYEYICTHVDDFKIYAKDPARWMNKIKDTFLVKSDGPPSYYLGNDYNFSEEHNLWVVNCATYLKEAIRRIESDTYFKLPAHGLTPRNIPMPDGCHPETDDSPFLDAAGIRKFQQLIGMAQWAVCVGRLDTCYATSSLSRFNSAPREAHLELALHIFGYLKRNLNRRLIIDSRPLTIDESLHTVPCDWAEEYPDASEEIDHSRLPTPYGDPFETSIFFDADHAHDLRTRRSVSGILCFVGRTPVSWQSRRQGCIATSTYTAEFVAMRQAVEEAISLRFMLRCLGCNVDGSTKLFGDNLSTITSASSPDAELKKKHVAISYHMVREAVAAKIVLPIHVNSADNFADILTKALGREAFHWLNTELLG